MNPPDLARLRRVRHVALDMDGTIYCGQELFAETLPFLETLRSLGIGHNFLTNNSSKSVGEYLRHLQKLGVKAAADDVFTSAHACIELLKRTAPHLRRAFVVGTPGLCGELEAAGFEVLGADEAEAPELVIVGFDTELNYHVLCKATYWIGRGVPFYATHPDRVCPTNQPTILLDCGAICAAIGAATGKKPDAVAGKPEPAMLHSLAGRLGLQNDEIAMIGDRIYTDVSMAKRAGAVGVLTLTGEVGRADIEPSGVEPDVVIEHLGEFAALLQTARER